MTVGELIRRLQEYPRDSKVRLPASDGEEVLFTLKAIGEDDVLLRTCLWKCVLRCRSNVLNKCGSVLGSVTT